MRLSFVAATAVLLASASPLSGAEPLRIAPPLAWVRPVPAPPAPAATEAPFTILLLDHQVLLEPGQTQVHTRQQLRIDTAAGLSAGNLTLAWQPDRQQTTVHSVRILRGRQVIDLLAAGQTFSVLRRETNLEQSMLDGVLTASLQPEGLEVGDVLELSATVTTRDPQLSGTAELNVMPPPLGLQRYALSVRWPNSFAIRAKATGGLSTTPLPDKDGLRGIAMTLDKPVADDIPDNMPVRMFAQRRIEATSFADWAAIGTLLAPLYDKASVIPPSGPLRDEVKRIAAASADPVRRAELALVLTQDRIRYVALQMGQGGLVPQDAATTWTRRFGDCKAKTALLIGLLRELGISSLPVAVSTRLGDGMDQRLPMVGQFDHILVRAEIAGKPLFLDGTRAGDVSLTGIETPAFRWGVEVVPAGGRLIPIMSTPRTMPDDDSDTVIDASAGFALPAKTRATLTFRGDAARGINSYWGQLTPAQRDEALKSLAGERYPALTVEKVSGSTDPKAAEFRMVADGTMDLGRRAVQLSTDPDQAPTTDRKPGPWQTAPLALQFPSFSRTSVSLIVPTDFPKSGRPDFAPLDKVIAGIEHRRTGSWAGNRVTVVTTERTLVPEIPWAEAVAARPAIKALAEDRIRLRQPLGYGASKAEVEKLAKLPAGDEEAQLEQAYKLLDAGRPDLSTAILDKVLVTSPTNADALANRGIAFAWQDKPVEANRDFDAAEKVAPDHPVIFRGRGLLALKANDQRTALRWFDRAVELDEKSVFGLTNRASINQALGKHDAALADSLLLRELGVDDAHVRFLRAGAFRAKGEAAPALAELAPLAQNKEPSVQFALASHYRMLGRFDDALQALARLQAIKPNPLYMLVRAEHRSINDRDGRSADLKAFLTVESTSPEGATALGELLEAEGRWSEAIVLYTKTMARLSDANGLRLRRGIALIRSGKVAEGRRDIAASRSAKPKAIELNNRCWALATTTTELDLALRECNEALALKPNSSAFLDSRGLVHLHQGKLDLALADYDAALAQGLFSSGLMGRSFVHARRGDLAKAAADRQSAERMEAEVALRFARYGLKD